MTLMQLAKIYSRNALVLKEFKIEENGPCYLQIRGRKSGLFNWLKALFGLEDVTAVKVYDDRIEYSDMSRAGSFVETIPLSAVSNLGTGYLRPISSLIKGVVFAAIGVALFICSSQYGQIASIVSKVLWVLAAIDFYSYVFGKTIVMCFVPSSGAAVTIGFKRSLIEGVAVGREAAQKAMRVVSDLVRRKTQP